MNCKRIVLALLVGFMAFASAKDAPASLPTIQLPDLDGKVVSSDSWKGKVVVIDFWATWCVSCREAFPVLNDLQKQYGSKIQTVGISNESAAASKISKFVKKMKIEYLVLHDAEDLQSKVFGFESVPSLYVYGKDGKLLGSFVGLDEAKQKALKDLVGKALK